MTDDEEDRRKIKDERRHPSEKDETAMPRRAHDSGRVRKAIRTELEEVAEAGTDTQAESGAKPGRKPQNIVISLENISLSFEEQILDNISFEAYEGETIVVVGESGTGKSTILKLLLRLLIPDNGRVAIDGEDITHLTFDDALKVRQKMGMVFQGAALFDSMTVYENVAYPLREHTTLNEDEIEARVREKLQFVDLEADKVMDQMPSELSGGMKKRVGIARGLANNPEIMLYDEPTSGLDPLTTATITYLILKLQRELGVTSIVVSHDIRSAFRMASKIALLANKRIEFFGTPEEMTGSEEPYIREFLGGF
ncbi:MAG TPA: ATP-binding cassette domain-containing protein [Gemmatimonadaceae bacterium]